MTIDKTQRPAQYLEPAKMIVCMLPDDGTDIKIKQQLRKEKNVNRVVSVACRGVNNLQAVKTRLERLPEPILGRIITIIVTVAEADEVFDYVCDIAQIGLPDRGALVQTTLLGATRYDLPEDVPDEIS